MISIGNFFSKHQSFVFILLLFALFLPSQPLVSTTTPGFHYYLIPIIIGLCITTIGQLIRATTIGLRNPTSGGKSENSNHQSIYTEGLFKHSRNPLYVGNILIFLGLGILGNSLFFVFVLIPLLIFIYQAIVLAEERLLMSQLGRSFYLYCKSVNRWLIDFEDLKATLNTSDFNWKNWILHEHKILFIWLSCIAALILLKHPQFTDIDQSLRNVFLCIIPVLYFAVYKWVEHLKKTGWLVEYSN